MDRRAEHLGRAAVFAAIVQEGSFSRAAEALGLARSTASEHVTALESALGVRLLERTTRTVRLTEEGELVFERIDAVLRAWDEARGALEDRRAQPIGTLRVTAPGGLASSVVAPLCGELLREHARVSVELLVDDRVRDLVADRIDVAIRMAPLQDSSMICRKLGTTGTVLVGAPSEAAIATDPGTRESLLAHRWVGHLAVSASTVQLRDPEGVDHELRPSYAAHASSTEGEIALLEQGCGIALMPELLVRASLQAGRLVSLYPRWQGRTIPIYAVTPRATFTPARVAWFLERLGRRLQALG